MQSHQPDQPHPPDPPKKPDLPHQPDPPYPPDRHRRTASPIVALALLTMTPLLAGQGPLARRDWPTFSADVQYVEVDVRVTDAQGAFVRSLTRDDFAITEDGALQQIAAFELVDLPRHAPAARLSAESAHVEPEVASNASAADARVFVLVLDDLHTDPSRSGQVRAAARQFLERFVGPSDLVSIVQTSGRADANQEFTSRASVLLASADRFMGRKLPSSTIARQEEYERQQDRETRADIRLQHVADPLDAERGGNAETTLETLQRVGRLLMDARGRRKAVVLISEGIDYDVHNRSAQTRSGLSTFTSKSSLAVAGQMQQAIAALTRANVTVNAIDPRGLAIGDAVIESAMPPQNPALGLGPTSIQDEVLRAQGSLRMLAEETGGVAAIASNDFAQAFDRIMQENSTYYLLAYQPTEQRYDGRFRRIHVDVTRPGLQVRARRGYVAPSSRAAARPPMPEVPGRPSIVLQRLLNSPLPVTGIPLRAVASPFKGLGRNGSVLLTVEIDARDFRFLRAGGMYTDQIEAAVVPLDRRSNPLRGDRHEVNLRLKPDTYASVQQHGVRLLFRLELPPGRYRLRAAVTEEGAGTVGSVHCDVEVPDFTSAPLTASGIVLTSTHAAEMPTARPDAELEQLLKTPPTSAREFVRADTLAAAFALYHDPRARVGIVDIETTVLDEGGQVRFARREQASEEELKAAPDGYGYVVPIPLADLTEGLYVLRVQATARVADRVSTVRELPFRIR